MGSRIAALEPREETQKGPLRELFPDGGLDGFTGVVQLIDAWIVGASSAKLLPRTTLSILA